MKLSGFLAAFTLLAAGMAGTAQAADTITITVQNSVGESVTRDSTFNNCSNGSCTYSFSIGNGSTGTIHQSVSPGTYLRSVQSAYSYYDGTTKKECKFTARAYGNDDGTCRDFTFQGQRVAGTGSSPDCEAVKFTTSENDDTCTYAATIGMQN